MRLAVPLQRDPPCPPELTSSCRVRSPCTAATPHAPRLSTRLRTICHVAGHHSHGPGTPLARAATAGTRTVCVRQRSFSVLVASHCMSFQDATCRVSLQDATCARCNTLQLLHHAASACSTQHAWVACTLQHAASACTLQHAALACMTQHAASACKTQHAASACTGRAGGVLRRSSTKGKAAPLARKA